MSKGNRVVASVEAHFHSIFQKIAELDATVIFDDSFYQSKVIEPTYKLLLATVAGVTVIFPSIKTIYVQIMFWARDNLFVVEGDNLQLKPNAKELLTETIKQKLNPKSIRRGIQRWMLNKVLNFVVIILSIIMMLDMFYGSPNNNSIWIGFIFMAISWLILFFLKNEKMRMPHSPKNNVIPTLYFYALIVLTASYPFISYGVNTAGYITYTLIILVYTFLHNDGERVYIEATQGSRSFLLGRLSFALGGAIIGLFLGFSESLSTTLVWMLVLASLCFGFIVSRETRAMISRYLPRFANQQDKQLDKEIRAENEIWFGVDTRMYSNTEVGNANYNGWLGRIGYTLGLLISLIPIGAITLPAYIYFAITNKVQDQH
ncbi:hypothetical protein ACOI22_14310 [Glaciecola sp. 2405UD65-10]|uniref:hypothetical protein n=1 Tax=Glaciecola sp. 2405UD65-10 TaxID=3397244 RepID=UPI003B5C09BE